MTLIGSLGVGGAIILATGWFVNSLAVFSVLWALISFFHTVYSGAHGGYIGTVIPEQYRTTVTGVGEYTVNAPS